MRLLFIIIVIILIGVPATLAKDMSASDWYEEGLKSLKSQSYEDAIINFDRAIAEVPKYWDAWYGKGQAFYYLKRYEDGLDLCNIVLEDQKGPQGKSRARFTALEGIFSEAYQLVNYEPPIKGYGMCSGEIPEIYRSVEKRYDDALELDPNLTSAWNSKGIFLGTFCRFDESIACFDEALKIDSTLAEVWNNKGVSLDWMEKHNESMVCYDRAIELKPQLAVAWMNRARTLSLNVSFFSQAQANASWAIELDPSLENESLQMTWSYIQAF